MTVKARVSGVSTLCWHVSPSTIYTHSTAAEAECQGNKNRHRRGAGGVSGGGPGGGPGEGSKRLSCEGVDRGSFQGSASQAGSEGGNTHQAHLVCPPPPELSPHLLQTRHRRPRPLRRILRL
eukprot:297470-Prorocentrum_minimum.AAC.1